MGNKNSMTGPGGGSMPPKMPVVSTPTTYMPGSPGVIGESSRNEIPTDYLRNAMKYEPLSSNPDILVNPETQRAVYKPTGQDITNQINSNPALTHQIAQELRDKQDKEKSNNEKVLKAQHTLQMNNFMKSQDALAKAKPIGGLVGGLSNYSQALGDTYLGNPSGMIGSLTSDWHPMDRLSKIYSGAKNALIGN
jgi:hypothetical protein